MKKTQKIHKAVIVLHEATTGPAHDLRDYLLSQNVSELLFIAHPILFLKDGYKKSSRYEYYKSGKLIKTHDAHYWRGPEILLYVKDTVYTVYWCLKYGRFDYFFGVDNLNTFAGILLRFFGNVTHVVYYVIDYIPIRFDNTIVNFIYHLIERFAAAYANWTWNLSPRMIEARNEKWGKVFPHQMTVPHGVHYERIKRVPFSQVNKNEIIYMGTLLEKQGIQLVIEVLPEIVRKIKNITFTIIGKGPYENELKILVKRLNLTSVVTFLGYVESHEEMENRLATSSLAIALYDKTHDAFSYYADPGKIKNYLGAGVPVIMTDVPYVAREVKKAECGFIIPYKKQALLTTIETFMSNDDVLKKYRKNAMMFAKNYEWKKVFSQAFSYMEKK